MSKTTNNQVKKQPLIGIIMGSDSDLKVMSGAAEILDKFSVPYELTIVSAHRTPARLFTYGTEAAARGLKAVIAGAGGAAHLPGMVAALTSLPVIGVPVESAALKGIDSLYSIVQMPPGVPVATVAVNGAGNAGLLAVQILAIGDQALFEKMSAYKESLKNMVEEKAGKLEEVGYEAYLLKM
ncbi:MAG: 5-(carboxyamino)imidazole ribonucleotide mutase [Clostridia bacterium]|nr:5-(carboxyamino)imidazole ribonucleotide mutase [Clostridia bacterium]